jgi:hypothetical protein
MNNSKHVISQTVASLFTPQIMNVKPIEDEALAKDLTAIAKALPGAVSKDFELEVGDSLFRYFVEDARGNLQLRYTKNISDTVSNIVNVRKLQRVYEVCGIPVFKL